VSINSSTCALDVSRESGVIAVKNPLSSSPSKSSQVKRDLSRQLLSSRHKRALSENQRLLIKAWSGKADSQYSVTEVTIVLPGGGAAGITAAPGTQKGNGKFTWSILYIGFLQGFNSFVLPALTSKHTLYPP